MTRRTGRERVARTPQPIPDEPVHRSGLRQRNPVAYWVAIVAAVAVVLSTFATAVSAFL